MTTARRQYVVAPRIVPMQAVCERLGKGPTWFAEKRAMLEAIGFPRPLPILDGYDMAAVEDWLDGLSGRRINQSQPATGSADAWVRAADGA